MSPSIDLEHIERMRRFALATFGPGERTAGVLDHVAKELKEIAADPGDVVEWADLIILGIDGALAAGHEPADIIAAVLDKQTINEARDWPDWRTAEPGKAFEHVRVGPPTRVSGALRRVGRALQHVGAYVVSIADAVFDVAYDLFDTPISFGVLCGAGAFMICKLLGL